MFCDNSREQPEDYTIKEQANAAGNQLEGKERSAMVSSRKVRNPPADLLLALLSVWQVVAVQIGAVPYAAPRRLQGPEE